MIVYKERRLPPPTIEDVDIYATARACAVTLRPHGNVYRAHAPDQHTVLYNPLMSRKLINWAVLNELKKMFPNKFVEEPCSD